MKIAIHVLAILSALSVVTSVIVSDATDDDDYSFWVELKMVKERNKRFNHDSVAPLKFGAVLVSDSWILTRMMVFRCLNDGWGVVTCARSTLSNWEAIVDGQKRKITEKVLHPSHQNKNQFDFTHGVVLARLNKAVTTSSCVQPVSLSPPKLTRLEVGKELTIFWKQYEGNKGMIKRSNVYITRCELPEKEAFCASTSPNEEKSLTMKYKTVGGSPAVLYYNDQAYLVGIIMGHAPGKIYGTSVDTYIHFLGDKVKWIDKVVKSTIA